MMGNTNEYQSINVDLKKFNQYFGREWPDYFFIKKPKQRSKTQKIPIKRFREISEIVNLRIKIYDELAKNTLIWAIDRLYPKTSYGQPASINRAQDYVRYAELEKSEQVRSKDLLRKKNFLDYVIPIHSANIIANLPSDITFHFPEMDFKYSVSEEIEYAFTRFFKEVVNEIYSEAGKYTYDQNALNRLESRIANPPLKPLAINTAEKQLVVRRLYHFLKNYSNEKDPRKYYFIAHCLIYCQIPIIMKGNEPDDPNELDPSHPSGFKNHIRIRNTIRDIIRKK